MIHVTNLDLSCNTLTVFLIECSLNIFVSLNTSNEFFLDSGSLIWGIEMIRQCKRSRWVSGGTCALLIFKSEFLGCFALLDSRALILFLILVFILEVSLTNWESWLEFCFHCFSLMLTRDESCSSLISSMLWLIDLISAVIASTYKSNFFLKLPLYLVVSPPPSPPYLCQVTFSSWNICTSCRWDYVLSCGSFLHLITGWSGFIACLVASGGNDILARCSGGSKCISATYDV